MKADRLFGIVIILEVVFMLCAGIGYSINARKTSIRYLNEYTSSIQFSNQKTKNRYEFYLVKNPPETVEGIKELIDQYNEEHPVEEAKEGEDRIERLFIKETKESKLRDFQYYFRKSGELGIIDWIYTVAGIASIEWETENYTIASYSCLLRDKDGRIIDRLSIILH